MIQKIAISNINEIINYIKKYIKTNKSKNYILEVNFDNTNNNISFNQIYDLDKLYNEFTFKKIEFIKDKIVVDYYNKKEEIYKKDIYLYDSLNIIEAEIFISALYSNTPVDYYYYKNKKKIKEFIILREILELDQDKKYYFYLDKNKLTIFKI